MGKHDLLVREVDCVRLCPGDGDGGGNDNSNAGEAQHRLESRL